MTLEELKAARDALRAARFKGVRTVKYEGKEVTYKSDDEMASADSALAREISALEGKRGRVRVVSVSKGL